MQIEVLFLFLILTSFFIAKSMLKKDDDNETDGMESKIILISYLVFFCLLCAIISYFAFDKNPIIDMLYSRSQNN